MHVLLNVGLVDHAAEVLDEGGHLFTGDDLLDGIESGRAEPGAAQHGVVHLDGLDAETRVSLKPPTPKMATSSPGFIPAPSGSAWR